ncbi:hypothetical protein [Streptomyces sp. NPDC057367]|uniref:hypothetical protein n=1 Tax=unclassified Streptomyces TaxID=2593676 RepID=UPI00234A155E|nr:hypothetical protein [Streptomyces sp. M92]WCN05266.1 hypothetical protein M6G08_25985 [Streptomyces sp. M92]
MAGIELSSAAFRDYTMIPDRYAKDGEKERLPAVGMAWSARRGSGRNDTTVHDDAPIAFGGEKASGLGRFGDWVVDEFTTHHWVSLQHAPREFRY